MSTDGHQYVPILRGKQAEYQSLGLLTSDMRARMKPLIELPPISWDPEEGETTEARVLDPSLGGVGEKIGRGWGVDHPIFIELGLIPSSTAVGGGRHPVEVVFEDARAAGIRAIPVTGPQRDAEFQKSIKAVVSQDQHGICIRLDSEDFQDVESAIGEVRTLLDAFGCDMGQADLVLDFGEVLTGQVGSLVLAAGAVIQAIPDIDVWRTLTWAGTSFPAVRNYQANSLNTAPREDWAIWESLFSRSRSLPRVPGFGDYTVNGVQSAYDVSAAFYRSSPNLRYTTDTDYLVIKARHPRHGHEQFNDLCRVMIARPEFRGAAFSEGDAYINRCASGTDGPGNASTWRRAGVTHHLTMVADQLASLP